MTTFSEKKIFKYSFIIWISTLSIFILIVNSNQDTLIYDDISSLILFVDMIIGVLAFIALLISSAKIFLIKTRLISNQQLSKIRHKFLKSHNKKNLFFNNFSRYKYIITILFTISSIIFFVYALDTQTSKSSSTTTPISTQNPTQTQSEVLITPKTYEPIEQVYYPPTLTPIPPTIDPNPVINCRINENCGGGSIQLRSSACSNTTCCQVGGKWYLYYSKQKCTEDQNKWQITQNELDRIKARNILEGQRLQREFEEFKRSINDYKADSSILNEAQSYKANIPSIPPEDYSRLENLKLPPEPTSKRLKCSDIHGYAYLEQVSCEP